MANQLITHRLPIDYSLMSLTLSISYVWKWSLLILKSLERGLRFPPLPPKTNENKKFHLEYHKWFPKKDCLHHWGNPRAVSLIKRDFVFKHFRARFIDGLRNRGYRPAYQALLIWSRVPERTLELPGEATLSSVYMRKSCPCKPSQSWLY